MVSTSGNVAEFTFYRPQAGNVCIVGDFNGWRDGELPMTRNEEGYWTARLALPTGDYRFRYRADGEWFIDYAAFGVECGQFGYDSVVRIAASPAPAKVRPDRPSRVVKPNVSSVQSRRRHRAQVA